MGYQILADMVVVVHCAFFNYIVFGELLILVGVPLGWQWVRNPFLRVTHLAMILVVVLESLLRVNCPLTSLENLLLKAAGEEVEMRSFAVQHFDGLFGLDLPDESLVWPLIYGGIGGLIGLTFVFFPPSWKNQGRNKPVSAGELPNTNRFAALRKRLEQPRFLIKTVCIALAIGAVWYFYRLARVEACGDCVTLSQKFAPSQREIGFRGQRQGTTVRKTLHQLGAHCSDGVIYDWRGKKVVFWHIREHAVKPDEQMLEMNRVSREEMERLAKECTIIRMYNLVKPY